MKLFIAKIFMKTGLTILTHNLVFLLQARHLPCFRDPQRSVPTRSRFGLTTLDSPFPPPSPRSPSLPLTNANPTRTPLSQSTGPLSPSPATPASWGSPSTPLHLLPTSPTSSPVPPPVSTSSKPWREPPGASIGKQLFALSRA